MKRNFGIAGAGVIAALSFVCGLLVTGSASASSSSTEGPTTVGGCELSGFEGGPIGRLATAPTVVMLNEGSEIRPVSPVDGATWMYATVDADGNVTTHQGTDADMPADLFEFGGPGTFLSEARAAAGAIAVGGGDRPDGPIEVCITRATAVRATGAGSAAS